MRNDWRDLIAPTLSLLGSTSTLLCCALPALLISLGMGAVMAGLTSAVPGIIWLSQYKVPLFLGAGAMMAISSALYWHQRAQPCPLDPAQARACMRLRRSSAWMLGASWVLLAVGIFFAFIWPVIYL